MGVHKVLYYNTIPFCITKWSKSVEGEGEDQDFLSDVSMERPLNRNARRIA